jgi:hypothetical protein
MLIPSFSSQAQFWGQVQLMLKFLMLEKQALTKTSFRKISADEKAWSNKNQFGLNPNKISLWDVGIPHIMGYIVNAKCIFKKNHISEEENHIFLTILFILIWKQFCTKKATWERNWMNYMWSKKFTLIWI